MATEEYSVGYEAGYQDGWNAATDATPPQRTWVGLTDEEIDDLFEANGNEPSALFWIAFARAIEEKLKKKNNG